MSQAKQISRTKGLVISQDDNGLFTWSFTSATNECIRRFSRMQLAAMCLVHDHSHAVAARLTSLDGVTPDNLQAIERHASLFRFDAETIAIEWIHTETHATHRHLLSPFTSIAIAKQDLSSLQGPLMDWLCKSGEYSGEKNILQAYQNDQACWLALQFPGVLFAHLMGLSRMEVAPRSCLARAYRCEALAKRHGAPENASQFADVEEVPTDTGTCGLLVEATLESEGGLHSLSLIKATISILKENHHSPIQGWTKRLWSEKLASLTNKLGRSHPAIGLSIGWVAFMIEFGTVQTTDPSLSTIRAYATTALEKISLALGALSMDTASWTTAQLVSIYKELLSACPSTRRGHFASAIASFHGYLCEWLEVEPLKNRLGQFEIPKQIHANLVWPHELALAIHWTECCQDRRLGQIAACMLSIAHEQPVRIQDLRRLNLRNIEFIKSVSGEQAVIEIIRDARRGRLKTDNAQRRIRVTDPKSVMRLKSWHQQRLEELAPMTAFLFGEENDDRLLYRPAVVHSYLNSLLKAATGDPTIRFHTLRHTAVSHATNEILSSCAITDTQQLERLANCTGHGRPQTTLLTYSHIHETAVRMWMDYSLSKTIELSGPKAESISGIKANTLTTRSLRHGTTRFNVVRDELNDQCATIDIPAIDAGMTWEPATPPRNIATAETSLTLAVVTDVLLRFCSGSAPQPLARLMGMSDSNFAIWITQFRQYLLARHIEQHPRCTCDPLTCVPELLEKLNAKIDWLFKERTKVFTTYLNSEVHATALTPAIYGMEMSTKSDYFSMENPAAARKLLQFIRDIGMNPRCARLVTQLPKADIKPHPIQKSNTPTNRLRVFDLLQQQHPKLVSVFQQELGIQPVVEASAYRIDRPSVYLIINPDPSVDFTPSAKGITPAFRALLLIAKAYTLAQDLRGTP